MSAVADHLVIAGVELGSRLFLGTGGLPHVALVGPVLAAAQPALVTVSMRRTSSLGDGGLLAALRTAGVRLLPNTAGCLSAREAVLTAMRELEETGKRYALCTMCIGVGQGMATIVERI